IDAHVYLPDNILTKADRMSMAHSLEARVPYLDRALVELAARLPRDVKLRGMVADVLSPTALRRVGLFDPAYVETLIGEHNAMRVDHSRPLWTLLVFM